MGSRGCEIYRLLALVQEILEGKLGKFAKNGININKYSRLINYSQQSWEFKRFA
jgi:hypothetical protein